MRYKIINGAIELGGEPVIGQIEFEINDKDRIAIVGRNGAGKSTFLKALVDSEAFTDGASDKKFVVIKEGNPSVGFLRQNAFEDESITMIEEILKVYKQIIDLEIKVDTLAKELETSSEASLIEEYTKCLEDFNNQGGRIYKKEYELAIRKFAFKEEDKYKKLSEFSGGQKTKIAFIKLLLSKPDILLLDEPTNHLDIATIEWLEIFLKNYPKAFVVVSHDRMFLDKIVNKVYEIEYGEMNLYSGNYTFFEEEKRIRYERQLKDYEYQQKEIKRLQEIADRFRYKPTKAKMAMSKLRQIEKMVKLEAPDPYDLTTFKSNFLINRPSGKDLLNVTHLSVGYDKALEEVDFDLKRGVKLAIIGANGTGKSTFLKTLIGQLQPLAGQFKFGHNVDIGYFEQQMAAINSKETVFENYQADFPNESQTQVRNSLAAFQFTGEDVFKEVDMLSGGEKVRLTLCKILKKGPNTLILDEPTNHLDIIGKESLENLLKEYEGSIIVVSHDRFFVNKVADKLLVFEDNKATFFDGKYSEYEEKKLSLEEASIEIEKNRVEPEGKAINQLQASKAALSYKEQNELRARRNKATKIEKEIELLEGDIDKLTKDLANPSIGADFVKLGQIQAEIDAKNESLEKKMEEWEILAIDL